MDQHSVNEDTTEEEINELIDQFMAQYNAAPHFDVTEETAETSVLYYKKNDMSTAKKYLRKLLDVNKDTKKFFKIAADLGQTDPSEWPQDGYLANSIQEYLVAYSENLYLYDTLEVYFTWPDRALSKMRKSNKGRR